MGVIYKLKSEVIEFIVQQKRDIPNISCRQLCKIASEKFQTAISKSSVNIILKESNLSSPVGRRGVGKQKPKPFEIPKDKKENLFFNVQKVVQPPDAQPSKPITKEASSAPESKIEKVVAPKSPSREEFERRVCEIRDRKSQETGVELEGASIVLVKAALERLGGVGALVRLFEKHVPQPPENFPRLLEALIMLAAVDKNAVEHLEKYNRHALWALSGIVPITELRILTNWFGQVTNPAKLVFEYESTKQQMFLEVAGVRVILSDGEAVTLDAQLSAVWPSAIPPQFHWPIEKSVAAASGMLISNNNFISLFVPSPQLNISDKFLSLVECLENNGQRHPERIVVVDAAGDGLAEFSAIPRKKRFFIVAAWPTQSEFAALTKSVKWAARNSFYHALSDQAVFFTDTKSDLLKSISNGRLSEVRVITLWPLDGEEPIAALLTNDQSSNAEAILVAFLDRWNIRMPPDFQGGETAASDKAGSSGGELEAGKILKSSGDILLDFSESLINFAQKMFGPGLKDIINQYNSMPYKQKGQLLSREEYSDFWFVEKITSNLSLEAAVARAVYGDMAQIADKGRLVVK